MSKIAYIREHNNVEEVMYSNYYLNVYKPI